jgi:hypothetical protein
MTNQDEVHSLAAAIREHAQRPYDGGSVIAGWQQLMRDALESAQVSLTPEEFDRAWRWLWKSSFLGGSYTQDARRVLTQARGES